MHKNLLAAVLMVSACLSGVADANQAPAPASSPTDAAPAPTLKPGEIRLTYLGNAGWEITDGRKVILVDPFLTQFARWSPDGPKVVAPGEVYAPDTALIDKHVNRADYILVTHGHSDHALDAGYIARKTGAVIIGRETTANLARAYDVPEPSLITVIGGEDYDFEDFSLKVIPSIHSALDDKRYFNNGRGITGNAPKGLRAPLLRKDYVEGGSLAYLLRIGGHEILIMGSMNFIEREMQGLRPDIALVGSNSQRHEVYDFTGRLMRALGNPAFVLPTHADSYGDPKPSDAILADQKRFEWEVKTASPATQFIRASWFQPVIFAPRTAGPGGAAGAPTHRTVINPPGIAPLVPAYSVAIRNGDRLFVSGMTGFKPGTQDIVKGGVAVQTQQTLENIRTAVQAGGASMADVDECTVFLMDMADYPAMNTVYQSFFPNNPPARATLAVSALPRPAALVEIKCSATHRQIP